jgi:hypothetical protein
MCLFFIIIFGPRHNATQHKSHESHLYRDLQSKLNISVAETLRNAIRPAVEFNDNQNAMFLVRIAILWMLHVTQRNVTKSIVQFDDD